MDKKLLNVPNALSLYRLLSFPFVLFMALAGIEDLFVFFILFNLITDILDGVIARAFKLQTDFGARLDSLADVGTYILAIVGVFKFKFFDFEPHFYTFFSFIGLFIMTEIFSLLKFGKPPCLHLYACKLGGYIQGAFFFLLFAYGFYTGFYYFMVIWGILAFVEHLLVQILIDQMIPNQKGLYWVLKSRNGK